MPGEVPSDVPPAAFGRFRSLHQIGVGSLGPVFRGEDPRTQEAVAIKQLRLNLPPELAGRVADQLRALVDRQPQHPGLIPLLDAGRQEVDPFLVTPLVAGESLDVALREFGPAVIVDALPRLQRLADALDRAAAAGVWHGALHPRDILVSGRETQLAGIGIQPILERVGVRRPARRPYAAPEVVDGAPSSPRADQYALAAIAYEWLFGGRAPISAESVLDAPALDGVDAEALAAALMTALAPQPANRFESCAAFVAAVSGAVRGAVPPVARVAAAGPPAAPSPPALLPFGRGEPSGAEALLPDDPAEALLPDDPIVEITPPSLALDDLVLDDEAEQEPPMRPPPPRPAAPLASGSRPGRVAWQGSFGAAAEPPADNPRRGVATGTLVAAVVAALAIGGVGGYLLGSSRATRTAADAAAAADAPSDAVAGTEAGRDFTDAPVAAAPDATAATRPVAAPPAAPVSARLLVRSSPAGASVAVDGTPRGTTPLTLRDLTLGTRTVVISRPGYRAVERSITLTADRPSRSLEVQLTPSNPPARAARPTPPVTTATLVIESRPSGASITLDGKPVGTTPLTLESIAPGKHSVRLELIGHLPVTIAAEVKAGERRRVAASLEAR